MGRFSKLTDQELDRLIAGKAPLGDDDLSDLAGFLRDVRQGYHQPPSTETADRHLAAITQAAAHAATDVTPGETLAAALGRPATSYSIGRFTVRNPLSHRLAIVVGAAALMLAAFGGVAHAGALPAPVQTTVSDVAGNLGISVPTGDENNVDEGDQNNTDQPDQNNTDQPDQNNVDEGDQNNVDEGDQGNTDQPDQSNIDQGDQGNTDQPNQGDADQGDQGNTDQGNAGQDSGGQGNADQGDQGSGGSNGGGDQGGNGQQGGNG